MKKYIRFFFVFFLFGAGAFLSAQTADEIDTLLETEAVSYAEAARFVLEAADIPESQGNLDLLLPAAAFRFAAEQKWLPENAAPDSRADLEGVSLLLMRSFNLKGGIFYSIFQNGHYAYRELFYREIIQGKSDPRMAVSGDMLLFLVGRVLSLVEEDFTFAESASVPDPAPAETARRDAEQEALAAEINSLLEAQEVADTSARITDEGVTISLSNIQFMADSAELPEAEKRKLQEVAKILESIPMRNILVSGHTALSGTMEGQLRVSQERAQAVASYLILLGVRNTNEVFYQGYGADRPIADNSTPQGMARNRRVEITILENQR